MAVKFRVSLDRLMEELALETSFLPSPPQEIFIESSEVNRPGLQMAGFYKYFDHTRIQIFGLSENSYASALEPEIMAERIDYFMSKKPVAVIYTRGLEVPPQVMEAGKKYGVPMLTTAMQTSGFVAALIAFLNLELAPRITRHGVLVEVYGEGILLLGDSGVGKSETAIELIKRGHRLIADDAVELRKVSNKTILGTAPENIRYFIELRGIGVVNVRRLFGVGAVKYTEKIDLVIELEVWDSPKVYDRMGLDDSTIDILGISVPCLTIPIKPGRNLAVIIETAAMNNREKKLGYSPAKELMERLGLSGDDYIGQTIKKEL